MTILPYELARTSDSLTSRAGLVVALEMMNHLKLESVVNVRRVPGATFKPWC